MLTHTTVFCNFGAISRDQAIIRRSNRKFLKRAEIIPALSVLQTSLDRARRREARRVLGPPTAAQVYLPSRPPTGCRSAGAISLLPRPSIRGKSLHKSRGLGFLIKQESFPSTGPQARRAVRGLHLREQELASCNGTDGRLFFFLLCSETGSGCQGREISEGRHKLRWQFYCGERASRASWSPTRRQMVREGVAIPCWRDGRSQILLRG